jgi:hypothetical protein
MTDFVADLWSDDVDRVREAAARADSTGAPNWAKIEGALTARSAIATERAARAAERTAQATMWLAIATFALAVTTVALAAVTVAVA